jgi:hypothetical protein
VISPLSAFTCHPLLAAAAIAQRRQRFRSHSKEKEPVNEAQEETALLPHDLDQQPGFETEDDNRDSVCVALPVARQRHGSQRTQRWREMDSNFRFRAR